MFSGDPPNLGPLSNRNNVNYAGPIPYYLVGAVRTQFPVGTRDYGLASAYNQGFGMFQSANNFSGRLIQMALKFYF